jgi:hypothetical protein
MDSYPIQLWLQHKWDMMSGLGQNQNKDLHDHMATTRGKKELKLHLDINNIYL